MAYYCKNGINRDYFDLIIAKIEVEISVCISHCMFNNNCVGISHLKKENVCNLHYGCDVTPQMTSSKVTERFWSNTFNKC